MEGARKHRGDATRYILTHAGSRVSPQHGQMKRAATSGHTHTAARHSGSQCTMLDITSFDNHTQIREQYSQTLMRAEHHEQKKITEKKT